MPALLPFIAMGAGVLALTRGLFRPHRALAKEGAVVRCGGPTAMRICDPSIGLVVPVGADVYATAPGKVVAAGEEWLHILVTNEPVVLMYDGVKPAVQEGQHVGRGQSLGSSVGNVSFAVSEFRPGRKLIPLPASAWLAARGLRPLVSTSDPSNRWCETPRKVLVPKAASAGCNFRSPEAARFGLLPVEIRLG